MTGVVVAAGATAASGMKVVVESLSDLVV